ncbi:hypothetical protein JEZ13_08145 [bacterium]|nr:hypothetical protein [bacterium]
MGKYTLTGSQEFDNMIDDQLKMVTEEILNLIPPDDIAAILLGGGYGRGEGGVLIENNKEFLYNDYDLFVILKNVNLLKKRDYQNRIHLIHEKFTPLVKIDVDVGPLQTVNAISKAPHWMMWYELKNGFKLLWGNQSIRSYFPDYPHDKMPLMEAYRLLLNRGVGLLLCKQHFETYEETESQEFILRNIRKAQLAMGDAYLIKKKSFHYSYKKRDEIFSELENDQDMINLNIYNHYKIAYQFKEKPHKPNLTKEEYLSEYHNLLTIYESLYNWIFTNEVSDKLNLETYQKILNEIFTEKRNLPDLFKNICKSIKINYSKFDINLISKHPRYRLFMTLPYFLFNQQNISCQKLLSCNNCSNEKDLLKFFFNLWEKNN